MTRIAGQMVKLLSCGSRIGIYQTGQCVMPTNQALFATKASSSQECDYVVVGAGSAGSVLTNRLSEDGKSKVIVVEAGPPDYLWDWRIHMPAALKYNLCGDRYNWYYHTVPQKDANNRDMYWPRGRVWGGSSAINAMVYIRGNPMDFDQWQEDGADGWSYADVLPYFRKAQTHELGSNAYRGESGPLHVSRATSGHELHDAFIRAAEQAGYPVTEDFNGYQQEGVGPFEFTIHKGKRWGTSQAYLRPALTRPNVTIESKALTTRVLLEGKQAVGIEYEQDGKIKQILAKKEVILCGGTINSPQLLMLSGIGPAEHLKEVGVKAVLDLPGVGENLQDHLAVTLQHKCSQPITLYSAQWKFPHNMIGIGLKWYLTKTGWGATSHLESGGFIRSSESQPFPDIQWHFLPSTGYDHGRVYGLCHSYQLHAGTQRALSRGTIKLADNNPNTHPLIDPKYLSHPQDISDLRKCVRLTREVFRQPAFEPYSAGELFPGEDYQTDKQLDEFIRDNCIPDYHPSSTCKMGTDCMAVTDNQGRVHEMESLRVVDASIMPHVTNGNLNAPVIMMAEKIADSIRGLPALPRSDAPFWKPLNPDRQRDGLPKA